MAATPPTTGRGVSGSRPGGAVARAVRVPSATPGRLIVALLLALITYAAFAQGATSLGEQARIQTAVALAVTAAAAVWLWGGALPVSAPRLAWVGLALLGGFVLWSALSLAWTVAPDRTLLEANRAAIYVTTAGLGLAAASWWRGAAERLAVGYVVIAAVIGLYALGGKIAPGVHLDGLFDLNHAAFLPRLRAPLEYWNALGLVLLLAAPIDLALVLDSDRSSRVRLAALAGLQIFIVALAMTLSRGGVIALLVGLAAFAVLSGRGVAMAAIVALAALASVPPVAYAFSTHSMVALQQPLGDRELDGLILGVILAASLGGLMLAGRAVLRVEHRLQLGPLGRRRLAMAVAGAATIGVLAGGTALAASKHGVGGTISREWAAFRKVRRDPVFDPRRLITTNSGNRWAWWTEAAGAWSDRPVGGWGAGSFPVVHLQYRTNDLQIQQPHSVPLQLLSEIGTLGFILAAGGLLALVVVGIRAARAAAFAGPPPAAGADSPATATASLLAVGLAAALCAWLVHGLYDWDLDIPGVTLPALAFMGVLAGRRRSPVAFPPERTAPARVLALAGVTLGACAAALCAIFPAWSDSKASGALESAGGSHVSSAQRRDAARSAELASRLDPLATKPLLALASIEQGDGNLNQASAALRRATRRQAADPSVWLELVAVEAARRDVAAARAAARHASVLDPRNVSLPVLVRQLQLVAAGRSPTAIPTPLPVGAARAGQAKPS